MGFWRGGGLPVRGLAVMRSTVTSSRNAIGIYIEMQISKEVKEMSKYHTEKHLNENQGLIR